MRSTAYIFLLASILLLAGCNGSRKYFKAAERLEKQGLVSDAAEYYLESLQRKPTSTRARIKLKEVGQKHLSSLSSDFFRNFNTQQTEASLESFEKIRDFHSRAVALHVELDYPKTYEDDYLKAIETYCLKNYNQSLLLVNQKKYSQAMPYITSVKKYNGAYKNIQQLEIVAVCEPLYQSAINSLENKNYSAALGFLSGIKEKTSNYKDYNDLLELSSNQQTKSFILFEPKPSSNHGEKEIQEYLFNNFGQTAVQNLSASVKIINNTPFQNAPGSSDLYSSNNVDLIQAIRKATGADYFYVFDIDNRRESTPPPMKSVQRGFQEVVTRKNDTLTLTEYKPFDYNQVKAQRSFSYDFKYKIINAYTNQIVSSQTQNIFIQDVVQYQEFIRPFKGDINTLYPYNRQQTPLLGQYSPRNWRSAFSAPNSLKSFEELKNEANAKTVNVFVSTAANMK